MICVDAPPYFSAFLSLLLLSAEGEGETLGELGRPFPRIKMPTCLTSHYKAVSDHSGRHREACAARRV